MGCSTVTVGFTVILALPTPSALSRVLTLALVMLPCTAVTRSPPCSRISVCTLAEPVRSRRRALSTVTRITASVHCVSYTLPTKEVPPHPCTPARVATLLVYLGTSSLPAGGSAMATWNCTTKSLGRQTPSVMAWSAVQAKGQLLRKKPWDV